MSESAGLTGSIIEQHGRRCQAAFYAYRQAARFFCACLAWSSLSAMAYSAVMDGELCPMARCTLRISP